MRDVVSTLSGLAKLSILLGICHLMLPWARCEPCWPTPHILQAFPEAQTRRDFAKQRHKKRGPPSEIINFCGIANSTLRSGFPWTGLWVVVVISSPYKKYY